MEKPKVFDVEELDAVDTAEMVVSVNGQPTSWRWIFAGPAHPKSIAQSERLSRERLRRSRLQEQAQVNGKKWTAPDESPDEVLARNVTFVVERLLGWSPVRMKGEDFPFSEANARALLSDRRKLELLNQAFEFLASEGAFTKRSATDSDPSPSAPSISTLQSKAEPVASA